MLLFWKHIHSFRGYDLIVIKYYSCNCCGPMRKEGGFYFKQSSNDVMMHRRKQTCLYRFDKEKFWDNIIFLCLKSTWTIVVIIVHALWAVIRLHIKSILAIWISLYILVFLIFLTLDSIFVYFNYNLWTENLENILVYMYAIIDHIVVQVQTPVMGLKWFRLGECWKALPGCCHLNFILKDEYLCARQIQGNDIKTSEEPKTKTLQNKKLTAGGSRNIDI